MTATPAAPAVNAVAAAAAAAAAATAAAAVAAADTANVAAAAAENHRNVPAGGGEVGKQCTMAQAMKLRKSRFAKSVRK